MRPILRPTGSYRLYILLALLLISSWAWSQIPRINTTSPLASLEHTQWAEIQQTPIERVYAIAQDSIGYLWIGSDRGLLRFDGSQLLKYNLMNTPLETDNVNHVEVDNKGVVWLANRRGVYRLEDGIMTAVLDENGEKVIRTTTFLLDRENRVWLTTENKHIYYVDQGVLKRYDPEKAKAYYLFMDQQGRMYAVKSAGNEIIHRFSMEQGMQPMDIPGLPTQSVQAVNSDQDGNLYWVTGKGEAWKWDGQVATQLNEATQNRFRGHKLLIGEQGDLWFGYESVVRVLADGSVQKFGPEQGLSFDWVRGMMADANGDIWIGTQYGLNRLSNTPFNRLVDGPWPNIAEYSMIQAPDDGPILVGTKESGLFHLEDGKLSPLEHPAIKGRVESLAFDKQGYLLVGITDGLLRFRLEEGKLINYEKLDDGRITVIHVSPQNDYLYIVANKEFRVYRNGQAVTFPSSGRFFIWMENTPDDQVWVGTRSGLMLWDGERLQKAPLDDPFFDLYMISYTPPFGGGNWIGSYGTGIMRVDERGTTPFTTRNGMPVNQAPYLLQLDENNVWLYVGDNEFGYVVRLIPSFEGDSPSMSQGESYALNQELSEEQDELTGYPFFLTQPNQKRTLFLGEEGPFAFEPGQIKRVLPKVRMEKVLVNGLVSDVDKKLNLRAGARNIEFHYGAIDFYRGPNLEFEYRLSGYEDSWQRAGSRTTAYYSSLPAGEYQFQVRVLEPDGSYILSDEQIKVVQKEFWYKQHWIFILYAFALTGLIAQVFNLRLKQIKQQRNKLKEQVALRTKELNELNLNLEGLVKERTRELTETEERYRYALDAADDGIFDWDVPSDSIKFSPAIYTMLGFEPYSFPENRKLILEKVHPEDQSGMDQLEVELTQIKDTSFVNLEFRMQQKDGKLIWVRLKAKIFERDKRDNPIRIVGTLNDITAEKNKTQEMLDAVLKTEDLERSRISKDIHDGLQQTLMLAKMNLSGVQSDLDKLPEDAADKFETGFGFLETSINESRVVAHNLMPKAIVDFGVIPAFENLVDHMDKASEETTFHFHHNFKSSKLDNQQIEVTLYRILQECLNNVIKYAKASRVDIQLMEFYELYVLTIEDNGVGFDMQSARQKDGLGFRSMKNRLDAINGFLEVSSRPGKGVSILVEIKKELT